MPDGDKLTAGEFGVAFKAFLERVVTDTPPSDSNFRARLGSHLGTDPSGLPIVAESFPPHDHPNLQLALDRFLAGNGRKFDLLGVTSDLKRMGGIGLGELAAPSRGGLMGGAPQPGSVDYANLPAGPNEKIACVQYGLYLIDDGGTPLAALVRSVDPRGFGQTVMAVEVMAGEREVAERFLGELRAGIRARNVYRGNVVSLSVKPPFGTLEVKFHDLTPVDRKDIVLPEGVLERIERQTIRFAQMSDRLRAAGRHLKRGLLLWGPPGTGKTLTAMYLARQMPERTVLVLTGQTLGLIDTSCSMARLLQPSTVILEDVDLVAEERSHQSTGTNAVLFELLNQMDGLAEDADVLFVLTSNRPELLEPALASRPGRIDEAIEVPLPDAECRSRLLDLYGRGLQLEIADRDRILERTEGGSASLIKEVLRKATLLAAEASTDDPLTVTGDQIEHAITDLVDGGGALTKTLLGMSPRQGRRPSCG